MADNNSSINSVSSNSDQHQISPNNVTTQSREKVVRINEMITKRKMHRSVIKFSQLILVEGMEVSVENLYVGMRLKGLLQVRVGLLQA